MKKFFIIIGLILIGWVLIGFVIPISYLYLNSYFAQSSNSSLKNKLETIQTINIDLPSQLNKLHCIGDIGTPEYQDNNNPVLKTYYEKFNVVQPNHISVCETAQGKFVLHGYYENAGSSQRSDIYLDNGNLIKLLTLDDTEPIVATDRSQHVYFLNGIDQGTIYYFDITQQKIVAVKVNHNINLCDKIDNQSLQNCIPVKTSN